MIPLVRSPQHGRNADRCKENEEPCVICGRPVKDGRATAWVHVHQGGSSVVTEEEAKTLDPASDLGCWPVGSDCLRRHPELNPYAVRS